MLKFLRKFVPVTAVAVLACSGTELRAQTADQTQTAQKPAQGTGAVPAGEGASRPQSTDPKRPAADGGLSDRERELRKYDPLDKTDPVLAEDPLAPSDRRNGTDPDAEVSVTRNRNGQDPDLTREYTGPAVLTRGYAVERPSVPENVKFRPYVGLQAVYDTGLTGVLVRPDGTPDTRASEGGILNFGIDGRRYWRHDILQVNYAGNVNRYSPASAYNGSNHTFAFDWTHVLRKRLKLSVQNQTSHYSLSYTLSNPLLSPDITVANVNLATTPNIQIFDNSTTQSSNTVSLTFQKTARLSFNESGSFFVIARSGNGLIGSKGYQAGNDVSYRFTKKTTAGAYYSYTQYQFTHGAGNTNGNTVGMIYSYAFDRRTELHARLGISILQNLGLTTVSIDPVIAQLLGQSAAVVQYYSVSRTADISTSFTRALRGENSFYVAYNRGTTPGNGLFVASKQEVVDGGFNFTFRRKYRMTFSSGRNSLTSLSQTIGEYTSENVHFGVSRNLARHLQSDFGFDYRHFEITESPLLRNQYRVTAGFSWTNSDFPAKVF